MKAAEEKGEIVTIDEYETVLLGLLNFLVWIRLISFLRIFGATRALIRLLVETMTDMGAFTAVLGMGIITFITCYHILEYNEGDSSRKIIEDSKHIYRIAFGDFVTDDYEA